MDRLPTGAQWQYEPKWDGFRCLAFRNGDVVQLQSKAGEPLERYFPELVDALRAVAAPRFVLDGEIVIPKGSFNDLQLRIHPAESRILKLAAATPAQLVVFDLLVDQKGELVAERTLAHRRALLELFAERHLPGPRFALSPATCDPRIAQQWAEGAHGVLDGVIAKRRDLPYRSGDRTGMQKIKRRRTADCVVGGFRYASGSKQVGSLLLGLYDDEGLLHHVGFTSALTDAERKAMTPKLESLIQPPGFTGRAPGGPSRWTTERSTQWHPLVPKLVVEVEYDQVTGGRFRHGTQFVRRRPDKAPRQCTFDQLRIPQGVVLDVVVTAEVTATSKRRSPAAAGPEPRRAAHAATKPRKASASVRRA